MDRTKIINLNDKIGQKVLVHGWVAEIRDKSKIKFMLLRDITGVIQCVVFDNTLFETFSKLTAESVITIEGNVKSANIKSDDVTEKSIEIEITKIDIINIADTLPIPMFEKGGVTTSLSNRLDNRFLDLRKPKVAAIFKIRSAIGMALREFFFSNGFVEMQTPKFVGAGAEGGSTLFSLDYFGKRAYLSQSQQLYKQMMNIAGYDRVFEIGPSFRAENSHTIRHMTEFTHVDVEISFIKDEDDVLKLEEQLLVYVLNYLEKNNKKELDFLGVNNDIPKIPFPRVTYEDGLKLLSEEGVTARDIGQEEEKILAQIIKKKYDTDAYFITKMPKRDAKFYAMLDGDYARYGDLEYKGNEITSGGQREHRYNILIEQIISQGLNPKDFEYYTTPFRYGAPPHGGFGLGMDRLVQFILNLPNVREAVLFPRDTERIMP